MLSPALHSAAKSIDAGTASLSTFIMWENKSFFFTESLRDETAESDFQVQILTVIYQLCEFGLLCASYSWFVIWRYW